MKHKKSLQSQFSNLRFLFSGPWRRHRCHLIREFGQGKLVRLPDGRHEFIGGTDADCRDALLWSSLFAHTIVFNVEDDAPRRPNQVGRVALRPPVSVAGRVSPRADSSPRLCAFA